MSTDARLALDRGATPWLFAVSLATTLPHFLHQPLWQSAQALAMLAWAAWLWHGDRRLPGRWPLVLLVAAGCGGIFVEYRTLFGRDAGVALLVILMAMKQLELRSLRDALVVVMLGYFLLLTHYFHSQDIPTGLWLLAAVWLVTATLIRLHAGSGTTARVVWRHSGQICLQALPFLLALYVLFPRISGPLWGLPQDAHAGRSGLSDSMSPGNIAELVQSAEIAFRVRFDDAPPATAKLYWRGPVLEDFDGSTWRQRRGRALPAPEIVPLSPAIGYETTLEAHHQRWLLALDAPLSLPPESALDGGLTASSRLPVDLRQRFRLSASLAYRFNTHEAPATLRRNLALPPGRNPQALALANEWRSQESSPEKIVGRALGLFNREFTYTLLPPLLGEHGIDDFLFASKRGFCEHYAAAFVFLMRAAGIPARVVTGYQGGEMNPLDGYLVVRQSDAHAWAEVWLAERGWQRVDPTAAVAPSRIERGIAAALPDGEPLPALIQLHGEWLHALRHRWEAINNLWNQQILGYDPQRQRELLSRLGWLETDWRGLAKLLAIVGSLLLALVTAWTLYRRPPRDPVQALWQKALRHLARRRVDFAPWETPLTISRRVHDQRPELAEPFRRVVDAYLMARYGAAPDNLNHLRAAIAQLP